MATYDELVRSAINLKGVLDSLSSGEPDFSYAKQLLYPLIEGILDGSEVPISIPSHSFFYRLDQDNEALHANLELMNAVAKLDVDLRRFCGEL